MDKQMIEEIEKCLLGCYKNSPMELAIYHADDNIDIVGEQKILTALDDIIRQAVIPYFAVALCDAGYRKIHKNAVVLTEGEYERWQGQTLNIKKVRKETAEKFAEKVEQAIVDNTYPYFDKDGKPVNIWKATTGFDKIDEIVKEFTGGKQ